MGLLKLLKRSRWRAQGLGEGICGSLSLMQEFCPGDFLVNAYVDWQIAFCLQSWLGEELGCFHTEVLLRLMEVRRTEWGKLASNSRPVCDLAS